MVFVSTHTVSGILYAAIFHLSQGAEAFGTCFALWLRSLHVFTVNHFTFFVLIDCVNNVICHHAIFTVPLFGADHILQNFCLQVTICL